MPHVRLSVRGPNKTGDPDFLYAAPDTTACAAFGKESRMRFADATKLTGNPGEAHDRFKLSVQLNPFGIAEPSD